MANRIHRAVRRGPKNQTWGAVSFGGIVDDSPAVEFVLMTGADWSVTGGLERGTLLRTRGWLAATRNSTGAAAVQALYAQIFLTDVDAPIGQPPDTPIAYLEDTLWTGGTNFAPYSALIDANSQTMNFEFDVKVMRKITSDQELRLILVCTVPGFVRIDGLARALVRRGGN